MKNRIHMVALACAAAATALVTASSIPAADAKGKPDRYTVEGYRALCTKIGAYPYLNGGPGCTAFDPSDASSNTDFTFAQLAKLEAYCVSPTRGLYTTLTVGPATTFGSNLDTAECGNLQS